MRVIKFRAYLEITNTMAYMDEKPLWVFLRGVHGCPLMQSTGLKDKNGVEIYEGDKLESPFEEIFKVKYEIHNLTDDDPILGYYFGGWDSDNLEVIGNIHQTPAK
jgi:hypothetical protein